MIEREKLLLEYGGFEMTKAPLEEIKKRLGAAKVGSICLVDLWLDGYDSDEQMQSAAKDFIEEQLNFAGSEVTVIPIKETDISRLIRAFEFLDDSLNDIENWLSVEHGIVSTQFASIKSSAQKILAGEETK